jgi:type IV secretory pathway VirB10-like protein
MNKPVLIAAGLIVAVFGAIAVVAIIQSRVPMPEVALTENKPKPAPPLPIKVTTTPVEKSPGEITVAPVKPVQPESVVKTQPAATPKPPIEPDQTPYQLARDALAMVGADPEVEDYWVDAISDPNLSDKQREDLMEDLNEVGLSDPDNPGPDDLQLIANRMRLIEEISPDADEFMLEHLGEAYKDLAKMYARLTQN